MRRTTKRRGGHRRITRGRRTSTSWTMTCTTGQPVVRPTPSRCKTCRRMTLRRERVLSVESTDTRQATTTMATRTSSTRTTRLTSSSSKAGCTASRRLPGTTLQVQERTTQTTEWAPARHRPCLKATTPSSTTRKCSMTGSTLSKAATTEARTCTASRAWDDRHAVRDRMRRSRRLRRLGLAVVSVGRWRKGNLTRGRLCCGVGSARLNSMRLWMPNWDHFQYLAPLRVA